MACEGGMINFKYGFFFLLFGSVSWTPYVFRWSLRVESTSILKINISADGTTQLNNGWQPFIYSSLWKLV